MYELADDAIERSRVKREGNMEARSRKINKSLAWVEVKI